MQQLDKAPSGAFCISGPLKSVPRKGGISIVGAKGGGKGGGGKARTPVEAPDSLHSTAFARVLDLVSEGPIVGPVHGLVALLRDIYVDGTPIQNEDGTLNFQGVRTDFRAGTQDQDYIGGFPAAESTIGVNVELRSDQAWTRLVTNTNLSAVRLTLEFRGLQQANTSNGDITGYRVEYAIDVQADGGAWQEVLRSAADGKQTNSYARSHRVDLPRAASGWSVRVRRLTPNANSSTISDTTFIQAITEIVDAKLRMPMSALVGVQVDASQFQSVPSRAFHFRGRIVSVPSNYNPETREYSGVWDGSFKQAYTNCPPWIFYDMVSNDRYGLGAFIPASKLSMLKWALYPIAQYCDELVPDGFGGMEPRFTCNAYLQEAGDAYRIMSDLASVFRGMVYEQGGAVMASADMPGDPAYTYTAANVIDGKFNYSGSARRTRFTVAQVSWNDMSDLGRAKMEAVEDREGQARYGLNITKLSAFGCTSRGQAVRVAKWALLTSQRETQALAFKVGMDHAVVAPGKVIRVVDPHRAGRRSGGRIREATRTVVTVDPETIVRPGDRLVVNLPNGVSESRVVSNAVGRGLTADLTVWTADSADITTDMVGLPGSTLTITVTQPFSETPEPEAIWTVESEVLTSQLYRVLSIKRQKGLTAEIAAVQHEPGKYLNVDYDTKIDTRPITVVPPNVQPPPAWVQLSSRSVVDQGIARHIGQIAWEQVKGAIAYQVEWRRDNSDWVTAGRTASASIDIPDILTGLYVARVRAINAVQIPSTWATSAETALTGNLGAPPVVTHLSAVGKVFGIDLNWGFPMGPLAVQRTEIWYSQTDSRAQAVKLGDFAHPQNTHSLLGLAAGAVLYFWARLVDRSGLPGEFYPAGVGVRGQSLVTAVDYLDYFNGLLSRDQLAQDLIQPIDKIPVIENMLGELETGIEGTGVRLDQEKAERVAADQAVIGTVTTLAAQVDTNDAIAKALVSGEATARSEVDSALGKRIDNVIAEVSNNDQIARGLVNSEAQARATADSALGTRVDTVQASVADTLAAVQVNASAISNLNGKLSATYTVKTQVTQNGQIYVAGMGLGAYDTGQGIQTSAYFLADRFALLNLVNGAVTTPFVIQNGQVFIRQALIGDGWITNAMIQNLDAAKVNFGQMHGDRITVNSLLADRIQTDSFNAKVAAIESAYVGTANIKFASVGTLEIANNAATVAAAFVINRSFTNNSGDNLLQFPLFLPVASTVYVILDLIMEGGSPATQNVYFGGNIGIEGRGYLPENTPDKFERTKILIASGKPSGSIALHIQCDRPGGGTRYVSGNVIVMAVMR